jgi:hypothetical protein
MCRESISTITSFDEVSLRNVTNVPFKRVPKPVDGLLDSIRGAAAAGVVGSCLKVLSGILLGPPRRRWIIWLVHVLLISDDFGEARKLGCGCFRKPFGRQLGVECIGVVEAGVKKLHRRVLTVRDALARKQVIETEFVSSADRIGEVCMDDDPLKVTDYEQGWVRQIGPVRSSWA